MIISNITKENTICYKSFVADTYFRRLKGLLGRPTLAADEGLLITPCRSIHTIGMYFAIDVVFLSADGQVVAIEEGMVPFRVGKYHRNAEMALELAAGRVREMGVEVGDQLLFH